MMQLFAACVCLAACQGAPNEVTHSEPTTASQPSQPVAPTQMPAAPVGETAATEDYYAPDLVVLDTPTDEEPLEVLPDVEELAEMTGLEPEPARVDLGRMLFHDSRLSKNHTVSCATCHDLRFGGVDRFERAVGIHSQVGPVNTPTVFNSAIGVAQFWDGRARNLQEQAGGPPEAAGEMGSSFAEIVARLQQDQAYVEQFQKAFPDDVEGADDIDRDMILEAIATFELTLVTPDSPFDRWLEGDEQAMSAQQLRGYALFKEIGCAECHYGPGVGGKAFQKLGRKVEYFTGEHDSHADLGRFNVTKDERDRHAFKVPTLRNIAATSPYFHNGRVKTLDEAVDLMAYHQLGIKLTDRDRRDIVQFLHALSGTYEGRPLLPATK